jgi:hypothetical protein
MTRLSDKLNHKKFKPFKILRNIKEIIYELKLLIIMRIYFMFYISLLKLASLKILEGLIPILEERILEEKYEVKKIINIVRRKNRLL